MRPKPPSFPRRRQSTRQSPLVYAYDATRPYIIDPPNTWHLKNAEAHMDPRLRGDDGVLGYIGNPNQDMWVLKGVPNIR